MFRVKSQQSVQTQHMPILHVPNLLENHEKFLASGSQGLQSAVAEDDGAPKPWVANAKKWKGPRGVPKGCKETSSDTELPTDDSSEERHWSRYYESKGMLKEFFT